VQTAELLVHLEREGAALSRLIGSVPYDAPVPTCADWNFEQLIQHVIRVHRWAEETLGGEDPDTSPTADAGQPADYREQFESGLVRLVAAVRASARPVRVPTPFSTLAPRDFWTRRMTHDTTIHRIDAELTADSGMLDVDADLATDGVDEVLAGFAPSRFPTDGLAADDRVVVFMPLDSNRSWTLRLNRTGISTVNGPAAQADLTVSAMASDLYRWVWNRARDNEVLLSGNLRIATWWHRHARVRSGRVIGADQG
jgi:uncharacterized protein (TIGR03083 family)